MPGRLFFRPGVYGIIIDTCISIKIICERLLWGKWLINWPITYGGPYCFCTTRDVWRFSKPLDIKQKTPLLP
jgi:hypothetical protein